MLFPAGRSAPQPDPGLDFYRSICADRLFDEARAFWRQRLGRAAVSVPDQRWNQGLRAILGHIELATDSITPSVPASDGSARMNHWVSMINVLQKAREFALADAAIGSLLTHRTSGQSRPEADNSGEILSLLGEHWRLTRDADWLKRIYPAVKCLAATIDDRRRFPGQPERPMNSLAAVNGAARDSHLELNAAAHDGNDTRYRLAFDIAGIRAAADMASGCNETSDAGAYLTLADELMAKFDASSGKTSAQGSWCHSTPWRCRLYTPDAPEVVKAFRTIGPLKPTDRRYVALSQAHQGLFAGNRATAAGTLAAYLAIPQMRGWFALGDVDGGSDLRASAPWSTWDQGYCMPHGGAMAEMWLLMRDSLLHETGGRLVLFAGIPETWFIDAGGMKLERMPTWFGDCSVEWISTSTGAELKMSGRAAPPDGFALSLPPKFAPNFVGEGVRLLSPASGLWLLPPQTRSVAIKFDRRLID